MTHEKTTEEQRVLTNDDRRKLLQGAAGIYLFFITYGRLQERIFRFRTPSGENFALVWFVQVWESLANVILAGIARQISGPVHGFPQRLSAICGVAQVMSKYCFSASLAAGLSFPVATLAKSAKLVPVMIGSLLLGGARFTPRQVSQASAIVGGTTIVNMSGERGATRSSSSKGLLLILAALACDGVVGGVSKLLKKEVRERQLAQKFYDLMFWQNTYMLLASLAFAAANSELRQGLSFCRANPSIRRNILLFSACGACGQSCVFYTISNYDAVVCTAITTTRKLASVLLSLAE
eukprot:CAMPEP_0194531132 /NCGR_PEP_ID=MMETSP0253-20130528/68358_1 /TAXON_ID=2966 /ORGANISM="Noctiluca scintillans" /LENGTH=293 /DNA_ID=CAMNT_0039376453 /DNA_START=12 /DNA_END=890 /DNA_ORIENTATION=-